jgi:hypothetical protein
MLDQLSSAPLLLSRSHENLEIVIDQKVIVRLTARDVVRAVHGA